MKNNNISKKKKTKKLDKNTDEYKEHISTVRRKAAIESNKRWKDPEVRKNRIEGIKKSYTPELRKKRSEKALKQMQDPVQIEVRKKKTKQYRDKIRISKGLEKSICKECKKEFWYNPVDRHGYYCSRKCYLKNMSEVAKDVWKTKRHTDRKLRKRLLEMYGYTCQRCGKIKNEENLRMHHKNYDKYNPDIEDVMLLCKNCHMKLHNELRRTEVQFVGINRIKKSFSEILKAMGVPKDDPNFYNTPERFTRMMTDLCWGYFTNLEDEIKDILNVVFPSENKEMMLFSGNTSSLCPHHFLPVHYKYYVSIIPNGYVLGTSKVQRLVDILSSTPDLQENFTVNIANKLDALLKPSGVMVVIKGQHDCMRVRGVKQLKASVVTSEVRGTFKENDTTRSEALDLIKICEMD